ncbi:DUF6760 family protein [Streptomyces viridosporus]
MAWVRAEVAFLGHHVHWTLTESLALDHAERLHWIREIATALEEEGEP